MARRSTLIDSPVALSRMWVLLALLCLAHDANCAAVDRMPPVANPHAMTWFRVALGLRGPNGPQNASASTEAEWAALKRRLEADGAKVDLPFELDFSKETILVVALGAGGSSARPMALSSLFERPEDVLVSLMEMIPGPNCGYPAIVLPPSMLVATIPRTEKHLTFAIEKVVAEQCLKE
jgi:hypothetical protein